MRTWTALPARTGAVLFLQKTNDLHVCFLERLGSEFEYQSLEILGLSLDVRRSVTKVNRAGQGRTRGSASIRNPASGGGPVLG